ncbi:MAG: Uma2 family endonuclease [Chloroflexi bacterium]|nr:Uma2 family endonuclease [Chloroflexota bacterium]
MVVQTQVLTVDEFWQRYAGQMVELVEGRVVDMTPSGVLASIVARRVGAALGAYVDAHDLGEVTTADGGFQLTEHDLRVPDAAFISAAKMVELREPEKFAPFAPDLAVEVISPGNTASEMRKKIDFYFAAGTRLVWIIYPELRKVDVHYPDGTAFSVDQAGILDGGDVVPGLQLPVSALFPPRD